MAGTRHRPQRQRPRPRREEMSSDGDEDYMEDAEEIDPTVFRIWDPLQKPVTLTYTTEQLHSERVVVVACTN